jgi:hypothetical protein
VGGIITIASIVAAELAATGSKVRISLLAPGPVKSAIIGGCRTCDGRIRRKLEPEETALIPWLLNSDGIRRRTG